MISQRSWVAVHEDFIIPGLPEGSKATTVSKEVWSYQMRLSSSNMDKKNMLYLILERLSIKIWHVGFLK